MKIKRVLAVGVFIVLLMAACAKETPVQDVSVPQLVAAVNTEGQFAMLFETEKEYIEEMTDLNMGLLEEYYFGDPPMINATTLYIAKVRDEKDQDQVLAAFEKRLDMIKDSFENYLPDQYELARQGVVVGNGRYVMLVIANDMEKALNDFENAIGG